MTQRKLLIEAFIGGIAACILIPLGWLSALYDEPTWMPYLKIHLIITTILVIFNTILLFSKYSKRDSFRVILLVSFIVYPFVFLAAFPFSFLFLSFTILAVFLGLMTPFLSPKTTWWVYTLGGRLSLPNDVKWLERTVNSSKRTKIGYKEFMDKHYIPAVMMLAAILGFIISSPIPIVPTIIKVFFLSIVFGISLTLGTYIRKKTI